MDLRKLKDPFREEDIEWRIGKCGVGRRSGEIYALVLAYVTNRAIMDRLDEVVGPGLWENKFKAAPGGGVLCCISILTENGWIHKWDGAENTNIEAVKGGLSGSMKRAAVQWGIGRYLYKLTDNFAIVSNDGRYRQPEKNSGLNQYPAFKWDPPSLPEWALPRIDEKIKNFIDKDADKGFKGNP